MRNVVFQVNNKNLYEDQILLDYIYPVLFTCVDDFENMYISVCYNADASKTCWLLAKVDPVQVIDLLENKVTIRRLFECNDLWNISKIANNSHKCVEKILDYREFDSEAFPAEGEYMDADEDEFAEEIEVFKKRIPLDSYQTRQEKSFTHSSNIVNIKLRGMPVLQDVATYEFLKDNQVEQLRELDIISICFNFKNAKHKGVESDSNTVYHFENQEVKEYDHVYVS